MVDQNDATQAFTEGRLSRKGQKYRYRSPDGMTFSITPGPNQTIEQAIDDVERDRMLREMTPASVGRGLVEGGKKGVANLLGMPGDIASLVQADPVGAREAVTGEPGRYEPSSIGSYALGTKIGAKEPRGLPPGERLAAYAGQVGTETLPFVFAPYGRVGTRGAQEFAKQAPKRYMLSETAATGGAALGSAAGEYIAPGETSARMGGEIVGGLTSPLSNSISALHAMGNQVRKRVPSFTQAGREAKAAKIIQETESLFGAQPTETARLLEAPSELPGTQLTAAQKAGTRGPTVLERKYTRESAKFGLNVEERTKNSIEAINENWRRIAEGGDVADLTAMAREREQYWGNLMDGRIAQAEEVGNTVAKGLQWDMTTTREAHNMRARALLVEARKEARTSESELWNRVPRDVETGTENIEAGFNKATEGLLPESTLATEAPVLNRLNQYLKTIEADDANIKAPAPDEITPISGELLEMRKRIGRQTRRLGADPNNADEVRRLHIMKRGIESELAAANVDASDANAFSIEFHKRFTQTEAGEVLRRRPTGGPMVRPELTLERSLAAGTPQGQVAARELRAAARPLEGMPATTRGAEMDEAQRGVVQDMLRRNVIDLETGRIKPQALARFRQQNETTLQELGLDEILGDVEGAARIVEQRLGMYGRRKKAVGNMAAYAKLLRGEDPTGAFRQAINGETPYKDLRGMFALGRRSPQAKAGARSALLNAWFSEAFEQSTGMISGNKMRQLMDQELILPSGQRTTVADYAQRQGILGSAQRKRLDTVALRVQRVEEAITSGRALDEVIGDTDPLYDLLLRWVGAQVGGASPIGRASGASLVMAGAASRTARRVLDAIPTGKVGAVVQEALENPQMYARLLRAPTSVRAQQRYWERFHAYLYQVGILGEEDRQQLGERVRGGMARAADTVTDTVTDIVPRAVGALREAGTPPSRFGPPILGQ